MEVLEQRLLSGSLQPVAWATLHQGERLHEARHWYGPVMRDEGPRT